jgi:CheY-like chemotaxis protein
MKSPKKIYYLDDDADDLYFFKEIAEELGHSVSIFINGNIMLKALGKDKLPDVIFLDIRMPVFDGEQILDVIKKTELWTHIPVVMISGDYPKSAVSRYLESGANYLMKKPADIADLRSSLEQVLQIDWTNFQAYS